MAILPTPDFTLKVNDTAPALSITCTYTDGTVQDLTGAAGTFSMWKEGDPTSLKVSDASATVVGTPSTGVIEYTWTGTDTNTAGDYQGEFHVTLASTKKVTFPNSGYLWIQISPRVA